MGEVDEKFASGRWAPAAIADSHWDAQERKLVCAARAEMFLKDLCEALKERNFSREYFVASS